MDAWMMDRLLWRGGESPLREETCLCGPVVALHLGEGMGRRQAFGSSSSLQDLGGMAGGESSGRSGGSGNPPS